MGSSDITSIFAIAGSGLQAQSERMKIVAQNIANADSTGTHPGQKPYQRQVVTFKNEFDKALGAHKVKVSGVRKDNSPFLKKFDPTNPAADNEGYVLKPNVKTVMEGMDMREAQRAYEANLNVIDASRMMLLRTIDLLR